MLNTHSGQQVAFLDFSSAMFAMFHVFYLTFHFLFNYNVSVCFAFSYM